MKIFKSATEKLITKEIEYKLHEKVLKDIKNEEKDIGVWGKAFVDAEGDENKTEAIYIKLMVQHYKDTAKSMAELEAIWNENYQKEQEAKETEREAERTAEREAEREAERTAEREAERTADQEGGLGKGTLLFVFAIFFLTVMLVSTND